MRTKREFCVLIPFIVNWHEAHSSHFEFYWRYAIFKFKSNHLMSVLRKKKVSRLTTLVDFQNVNTTSVLN